MKWFKLKREIRNNFKGKIDWNYKILNHIAIMMDGNGRWARRKGFSTLTLYAFSTENWKRPKDEVEYIIGLVSEFVQEVTSVA